MNPLDFSKISSIISGKSSQNLTKLVATGISTDTRTIKIGDLFFALTGPNFDGHKYISKAKEMGASGAVVDIGLAIKEKYFPLIPVKSPLTALGDLAKWYRSQFKIPVVAITGSAGKTTTKDLLNSILLKSMKVLSTEGNLNNFIGLPQMIFRLDIDFDVAVLELGMSALGEIYRLTEISQPQVGIITNIGHAHLEFLESIENVAEAKNELWKAMDNRGTAVINLDDVHITEYANKWSGKKITFSTIHEHADVLINLLEIGTNGKTECELLIKNEHPIKLSIPLMGAHNLYNAAAAAAGALALNIPISQIEAGLKSPLLTPLRSEILHFPPDGTIYNDTYNANPDAMEAALQCLSMMQGNKSSIAILGDMGELGTDSKDFHFDIGSLVAELKIDFLFTFGTEAKMYARGALDSGMDKAKIFQCETIEDILKEIRPILKKSNFIALVKGSRFMKMERIVELLKKELHKG